MNCPSCKKPPISLKKFVFALDTTRLTCASCGAELVMEPLWRRASKAYFWGGIMYGVLLLLNGVAFLISGTFPVSLVPLLLFGVVVEAIMAMVFWTQARYVEEGEKTSVHREGRAPSE